MGLPKDGYFIVCLITILLLFENSETLRSQIGRIYGTNECAVCGMDFSLLTINRRRHWSYFSTFFGRFWRPQRPVFSTKCPLEDAWGLYEHLSTSFCVKKSKFHDFFSNFYSVRFQNRAKSGNLGKIARFAIRVKPGIVLIEFVLSGDPLYFRLFFEILL